MSETLVKKNMLDDLMARVTRRVVVQGEEWIKSADARAIVAACLDSGADVATDWQVQAAAWRFRFWAVFFALGAALGYIFGR